MQNKLSESFSRSNDAEKERYYQIRVKSIDFLQKSGIAVYFYDLTQHIKNLELSRQLLKQEKENKALTLSQLTLSHEFRTPLSSSLMFLESLLPSILIEGSRNIILIVIA